MYAVIRFAIWIAIRFRHTKPATSPQTSLFCVAIVRLIAAILPRVKRVVGLAPVGANSANGVFDQVWRASVFAIIRCSGE